MKNIINYLILAAVATAGITACSDNVNDTLIPSQITKVLTIKPEVSDAIFSNDRLSLGAGSYNITVAVESNTRWKPEIEYSKGGGWCESDVFTGSGNGSFTLSVRDNITEERSCVVTVYVIDEKGDILRGTEDPSRSFTITQVASQVRLTPSSVEPFAAENPRSQEFSVSANEIDWTLKVTYESEDATEFVTVTNMVNMQEEGANSFSGYGDASFSITLLPNRTAVNRIAFLSLSSSVGNYSVEISQSKSDYTFDVTPSENQIVQAEGGTIDFGVLSPLCGWNVASSADWISFSPARGNKSDNRVSSVATIASNSSGYERSTEVRFTPDDNRYQSLSVTVVQRGYDLTFKVSLTEDIGVVLADRQTKVFNLDSRFNWEAEASDWINMTPLSGSASRNEQRITLEILENSTNAPRNGSVKFKPLVTMFEGDVELDPKKLGIEPLVVNLTQYGGNEPAVSVPWLDNDYTQTEVTVLFNYYSPNNIITGAGLEWRKADGPEDSWTDVTGTVEGETDGKVTVKLTGLDPGSEYVARGYVVYGDNQRKYGQTTIPFTTAGKRPSEEDNPVPEI